MITSRTKKTPQLLIAAVLFLIPTSGLPSVVTFQNLAVDHLNLAGPQIEAMFTYRVITGAGWEIQTAYGNPSSALTTFFNNEDSQVGDAVEFKLSAGGLFTFNSVDFRTILSSGSDRVTLTGYLGSTPTETLLLGTSPVTFQSVSSGFTTPIDSLVAVVTFDDYNALVMDNFNFTAVPEPGTLSLFVSAAFCLITAKAYRKRKS